MFRNLFDTRETREIAKISLIIIEIHRIYFAVQNEITLVRVWTCFSRKTAAFIPMIYQG